MKKTEGIHHITAIVGAPQENIDFYAGILGLRLVKKTVNFDDPSTYHFYFGNHQGHPGTIITFFPWAQSQKGKIGGGQVGVTTYVIPESSMSYWKDRLTKFGIPVKTSRRFNEDFLQFEDVHGLKLELVERSSGVKNEWTHGDVTPKVAIKGFGGAVLYSTDPVATMKILKETMGLEKVDEDASYVRYQAYGDIGNIVDVKKEEVPVGVMGVGTVHHIAWRALDDSDQLEWQKHVKNHNYHVTSVRDRNYFNAIYFREHGNILFEIATNPPGFANDESVETLGQALKLPQQYEVYRQKLEEVLVPVEIRNLDEMKK